MHSYSLNEARNIVMKNAKHYKQNLLNKTFLIIYKDRISNDIKTLALIFEEKHYQHLIGIELIDKDGVVRPCVSKGVNLLNIKMPVDVKIKISLENYINKNDEKGVCKEYD